MSNPRRKATICGAKHFDQQDEHGRPAALGVEGQLLSPQPRITRFPRAQQTTGELR
jgi:hypothetical protein